MLTRKLVYEKEKFSAYDAEKVAKASGAFSSDLFLVAGAKRANMKSLIGVIAVQLTKGEEFELRADGDDEVSAIETLTALFNTL